MHTGGASEAMHLYLFISFIPFIFDAVLLSWMLRFVDLTLSLYRLEIQTKYQTGVKEMISARIPYAKCENIRI